MDCSTIQQKIADYIEGTLPPDEKKEVEEHLTACEQCRLYAADVRKTIETLNSLEEVPPPPWLAQKVMQEIRAEARPKKGLFQKLFFPLHIKLPLEAAATLLIAGAAVLIMKSMGPDLRPVTTIPEKPLVQTLPSEKESLPQDKPAAALPKKKAEQTPAPIAKEPAGTLSDQSGTPAQKQAPVHEVPAGPVPAPVMRGIVAGKARDMAEEAKEQRMAESGAGRPLRFSEKKRPEMPEVTLQVMDIDRFEAEYQSVSAGREPTFIPVPIRRTELKE